MPKGPDCAQQFLIPGTYLRSPAMTWWIFVHLGWGAVNLLPKRKKHQSLSRISLKECNKSRCGDYSYYNRLPPLWIGKQICSKYARKCTQRAASNLSHTPRVNWYWLSRRILIIYVLQILNIFVTVDTGNPTVFPSVLLTHMDWLTSPGCSHKRSHFVYKFT